MNAIETTTARLNAEIESFQDARAKLDISTPSAAVYALSWMEKFAEQAAYAALCEQTLAIAEKHGLQKAIEAVAEESRRQLMNNALRGTSTSAFHNATEAAQRAAASRFVEKSVWLLSALAK